MRYLTIAFLCVMSWTAYAGVTGKLVGRTYDKSTNKPLGYVSITLLRNGKPTGIGAISDKNGNYMIIDIPVGCYTVEASRMGYSKMRVDSVWIFADMTYTLDFYLEPEVVKGQVIVVTAKRPIVERDVTASVSRVTSKEIEQKPVTNYHDVIAKSTGVVAIQRGAGKEIHIRGGRTGETVYIVDGVVVNDPFTGEAGEIIDNAAIEEMELIKSGFDAEYGQVLSGVANIVTKAGTPILMAGLNYYGDVFLGPYNSGYNKLGWVLSGPLKFLGKGSTFFLQGNWFDSPEYEIKDSVSMWNFYRNELLKYKRPRRLPHSDERRYGGSGTVKWERGFGKEKKLILKLSGSYGKRVWHRYIHYFSWGDWLRDTPLYSHDSYRLNANLTYSASAKLKFYFTFGLFNTHYHVAGFNGKHYSEWKVIAERLPWVSYAVSQGWWDPAWRKWKEGWGADKAYYYYYENVLNWGKWDPEKGWIWTTSVPNIVDALNDRWYEVNSYHWTLRPDTLDTVWNTVVLMKGDTAIFYHKFNLDKYIEDVVKLIEDTTFTREMMEPSGNMYMIRYNRGPDWAWPSGVLFGWYAYPYWHDRMNKHYEISFKMTYAPNRFHTIKAGGQVRFYNVKMTEVYFANENPYTDHYSKKPVSAAAYIQDKIEYGDLTMKPGLRIDFFHPMSEFYVDLENLDSGRAWVKPKWQISPRFGISYAVTEKSKMYAHYGWFFKHVNLEDLYQNLYADITCGYPLIGNPNLPPESQVLYEVGYEYAFSPEFKGLIAFYFKDVKNLLSSRPVRTIWRKRLAQYTIYLLRDIAEVKGMEITLKQRAGSFAGIQTSFEVSYEYQSARGTGSESDEYYRRYMLTTRELPKMEFPLDFEVPHTFRGYINFYFPIDYPKFNLLLGGLNINLDWTFQSGTPYTPEDLKGNPLAPGSKRRPSTWQIDVRLRKELYKFKLPMELYADILNMTNNLNIADVYETTGLPDDNGAAPVYEPSLYSRYYKDYGFESPEEWYNAVKEFWKIYVTNPYHYMNRRLIRVGIRLSI